MVSFLILQPTRVTANTATGIDNIFIDNIFSNNIHDEITSGNVILSLSIIFLK